MLKSPKYNLLQPAMRSTSLVPRSPIGLWAILDSYTKAYLASTNYVLRDPSSLHLSFLLTGHRFPIGNFADTL